MLSWKVTARSTSITTGSDRDPPIPLGLNGTGAYPGAWTQRVEPEVFDSWK